MKRLLAAAIPLPIAPVLAITAEININTADRMAPEGLDGIGPTKAEAIVQYRETNGPFTSVDDLDNVSGIGEATLEANRDRLTVE